MTTVRRLIASALLLAPPAAAVGTARAEPIQAGSTDLYGTATMDLTLLAGTPFNPGTTAVVLAGVSGTGTITLHRDAQSGSTILIPTLSGGLFYGSAPGLGNYVFGKLPPLADADFHGSITNVVQNPSDPGFATGQASSLQSGQFSFTGTSFGFEFLSGPAAGVTLFTDPAAPFSFAAGFDGLPPSSGTVLRNSGPDVLNVLFNGQVVAQSSNRTITLASVPEPSAVALGGLTGLLALAASRVRSRLPR